MRRLITFLTICITSRQIIFAQLPTTFQIHYYNTENALPSNGIKGMEWDEQNGFLWLTTEAGIVRFDGIYFKTYNRENTSFIASERMGYMVRNNHDVIYTSDLEGNIIRVHENDLILQRKAKIQSLSLSQYAMAVSDTFLNYKLDHPGKGHYPISFRNIISISDTSMLLIDRPRVYLVSTSNANQIPVNLDNMEIGTGFKIGDEIFLVSTGNNIYHFDVATQKLQLAQVTNEREFYRDFKTDGMRFFWLNGPNHPIAVKDSIAWQLLYDGSNVIARQICNVVPRNVQLQYVQYSDERKQLFIGTGSKGLIVITENSVVPMKKKSSESYEVNAYYSQVELQDGSVLTNAGHIIRLQAKPTPVLPIVGPFRFNTYTINDSLLWYARQNNGPNPTYLCSYNYNTRKTVEYPKISVEGNFGVAYSNNKIYVANNDGLGELSKDSLHYLFRQGSNRYTAYDMTEISPGILIIAGCSHLIRFNTINNRRDTLLSVPTNCIRALRKFNDYLFIGTYGNGYYMYNNGRIKAMPLDKNNYLLYVHCFVPDKNGYCWMSTNHGLFKARLSDLFNAFEKDIPQVYYHYFGRNEGMDITELNGGCTPCALAMKNGVISFPTMDGLLWLDSRKALTILPTGSIFIDEITADGKKIVSDSLTLKNLPADTKEIEMNLAFSAWCNKENLYIEYELNNSGKWERVADNDPVIRLYGLAAGDHSLRIRKMNGFGLGNYSYRQVYFRIATPWYQQWWFFVLLLLLAIALGRLFVRLRTRQYEIRQLKLEAQVYEKTKELLLKNELLEKNDTIKTRLISIISHDMITPLKFLTVAGKNLLQKRQVMPEELQQQTISEMTNTSRDLQLLSTNILNWIKYQNENRRMVKETFNVNELIGQVVSILNSWAKQKQLHISNEVNEELMLYQYAEPLRILIYNLVSNAINFSEKGKITIGSAQETDHLIIRVRDEGVGMTADQIENIMGDQVIISAARPDNRKGHGLGYLIIKDLIKMVGAEIKISSEPGMGTEVLVRIPSN